jgi:hypothetical protein
VEILITVATVLIAIFTGLVWKINKRMEWLTGAIESHSTTMLRIEVEKAGKEIIWWDPSIKDFPDKGEHQQPCELKTIYLGIHPKLRANQPESMCYRLGLFVRDFWEKPRDCWDDFLLGKNEEAE